MGLTRFKEDQVVVLLGAGASVDAGIPNATDMVEKIEVLVTGQDDDWTQFRLLYNYIRAATSYADGLEGMPADEVSFNVERLVDVLEALERKERHSLYPFIGAWSPRILDVAGTNFESIGEFRREIIRILRREWVELERIEQADYYEGLLRFQQEYQFPLRVFSLNYDLCLEKVCGLENVQRGFEDRNWDWRLFDSTRDDPKPILLYKLHGSTDWKITDKGEVQYLDSPGTIKEHEVAMIFGVSYKLQYVDPFLFLAYELRRWTLGEAKMIVTIGYGFGDEHINGILGQALRQDSSRRLLAVVGPGGEDRENVWNSRINEVLSGSEGQIVTVGQSARVFLSNTLTVDYLASHFPLEEDLIPEV